MSKLKFPHASGNSTSISAPAANPSADITLKVPSTTGSAGQVLKVASANHSSTNAELEWGALSSANITQWDSAWAATTSGNEHTITGIPATATHVRLIGEGQKIVDNADIKFQMGYGDASSNSFTTSGYRMTRGYFQASNSNNTSGDNTDSIRTYGMADLDYSRFHVVDWYKLNTSNLWSFRATVHFYNNESSGSVGAGLYFMMGDVTLGGTFYKVKAYNNTFSAGSFKLQAWY